MSEQIVKRDDLQLLQPDWPAPANVHAWSSSRLQGVSEAPYRGLNLALHVGDNANAVQHNRQHLAQVLSLPQSPLWLDQVHGHQVVNAAERAGVEESERCPQADAAYSPQAGVVCVVMTADCLPLLVCNRRGDRVAAVHAGWRGLAAGVIESTLAALDEPAAELLVWLGPAIGPAAFEVGEEVRQVFIAEDAGAASAFRQNRPGHYLADIYALARRRLQAFGVRAIYGGGYCTFDDANHFYSYRRDGKTGRQASLIWFD
jgi:YfiH family protein